MGNGSGRGLVSADGRAGFSGTASRTREVYSAEVTDGCRPDFRHISVVLRASYTQGRNDDETT
jgi:hypothetical protein